jgi:hypothetical protein
MTSGLDGQFELTESHLVEGMGVDRGWSKQRRLHILINNGASHLFPSVLIGVDRSPNLWKSRPYAK